MHCVKSVRIRSYSVPYFSREYEYGHFLRIDGMESLIMNPERHSYDIVEKLLRKSSFW